MRQKYIKPMMTADGMTILSALLTESYPGDKGGISTDKGGQSDFSVKDNDGWGNLW